jgi:hypothetical protein
MTSFAFIIGVIPLMISSGAGAASRHSLGSAVFGGMLAATMLGVFFIPSLYVLIAGLIERLPSRRAAATTARRRPPGTSVASAPVVRGDVAPIAGAAPAAPQEGTV